MSMLTPHIPSLPKTPGLETVGGPVSDAKQVISGGRLVQGFYTTCSSVGLAVLVHPV